MKGRSSRSIQNDSSEVDGEGDGIAKVDNAKNDEDEEGIRKKGVSVISLVASFIDGTLFSVFALQVNVRPLS